MKVLLLSLLITLFSVSCSPVNGPDKTVAGAVLGAGWGAGAGAVIGNQINDVGAGAAVGAGFGFTSGLLEGAGLDLAEETELQQNRDMDALEVQVQANERHLMRLQHRLDAQAN